MIRHRPRVPAPPCWSPSPCSPPPCSSPPLRTLLSALSLLALLLLLPPAGWVLTPATARAQSTTSDSVLYALASPPSEFEWGCFGPCACAALVQANMSGTFLLRRSYSDPIYTYYDVLDVRWKASGDAGSSSITGSGTYRRGGESAVQEELTLDLSFDGGPAQHFDSGLKPPGAAFPEIDTRVSLHGETCHDSILVVDAKPAEVAWVSGAPAALALFAAPNPFGRSTTMEFRLPHEGIATLRVFDASGRCVRTLVDRERLPAGSIRRAWDATTARGRAVAPGFYVARLEFDGRVVTRKLVALP